MALRTLSDSSVLAPLARAAERAGVDVVLFGSVAARALLMDAAKIEPRSMFELAEHVSDIDLAHTGPPSATALLQATIAEQMPTAPWFRWSIVDRDRLALLDRLRSFNIGVPLRQLRLGSQPFGDGDITATLLERALDGQVGIFDNEAFRSSPRSGYDTEASAVLLYIAALQDVLEVQQRSGRPVGVAGLGRQARGLVDAGVARLATLSGSGQEAALRRLWYRLAAIGLGLSPRLFEKARDVFGLGPLLETMKGAAYPTDSFNSDARTAVMVSAHLGKGQFRVPLVSNGDDGFGTGRESLIEALAGVSERLSPEVAAAGPIELAAGNDVIAAIRSIPVHQGDSASSIRTGPLTQEFIHIGLSATGGELANTGPEKLTAIVMGHGPEGPLVLPVIASVSMALSSERWVPTDHRVRPTRCTIRLNMLDLFDDLEKIDVFLLKGYGE